MNIQQRLKQLAKANREIERANLDYKNLRQEIGKEFRKMRNERKLKGITVANAIKEYPGYVYMLENGNVLLTEGRMKAICAAIERLGK